MTDKKSQTNEQSDPQKNYGLQPTNDLNKGLQPKALGGVVPKPPKCGSNIQRPQK